MSLPACELPWMLHVQFNVLTGTPSFASQISWSDKLLYKLSLYNSSCQYSPNSEHVQVMLETSFKFHTLPTNWKYFCANTCCSSESQIMYIWRHISILFTAIILHAEEDLNGEITHCSQQNQETSFYCLFFNPDGTKVWISLQSSPSHWSLEGYFFRQTDVLFFNKNTRTEQLILGYIHNSAH